MKGEEFLNKMELIDSAFIEQADTMPKKKKGAAAKIGALAACMAVAAVGALLLSPGPGTAPDAPVPQPDRVIQSREDAPLPEKEKEPEVYPSHTVLHPGDVDYVHPIYTPEPDDPTKSDTIYDRETGYVIGGPFNHDEAFPVTPCISSFGKASISEDISVSNGGVYISPSLRAAMEHYGDSVNYRVKIELFKDGVGISSAGDEAKAEAERLFELGYNTAIGTFKDSDGSVTNTTGSVSNSDTVVFNGFKK